MVFPMSFWDLGLWIAVITIILLITLELTTPYSGHVNLAIDRRRLRRITLILTIIFILTVAVRIYEILTLG